MTAYTAPSDPTNVVGRRIGAWIIDLLIYVALAVGLSMITGGLSFETYEAFNQEQAEFYCDAWQETHDGFCGTTNSNGDYSATTIEGGSGSLLLWIGHLVGYSVIQGLLGGSLGKLALGLRVVDEHGKTIGIGRSFVRTLAWILDAVTCGVPIIGGVMLVSTKGHRRLGDMIAGTYVVRKESVGQPVDPTGVQAPVAGAWGAPAGAWGAPVAGATWSPPGPAGPPVGGPGVANPWTPAPGGSPVTGPPVGAPPVATPADGPTWDPARNAYIQYDAERGAWLQWDDNLKVWAPISQ